MKIHAKVLDGKAPNPQRGSCKHLEAGNYKLPLLHCQTILGLKHLTNNKAFAQTARDVAKWHPSAGGFSSHAGSWEQIQRAPEKTSAAMLQHLMGCTTLFSVFPWPGDGCSSPRWVALAEPPLPGGPLQHNTQGTSSQAANWPKHSGHEALWAQPGLAAQSHSRVELSKYFEQLLISKAALQQLSISQCL